MLRLSSIVLSAALTAGLTTTALVAPAATAPGTAAPVGATTAEAPSLGNSSCRAIRMTLDGFRVERARVATEGVVTLEGWTMDTRKTWVGEHPSNPAVTQAFHSDAWLIPTSLDAVPAAVDLVVKQYAKVPDPGAAKATTANGWKESAVTLRTKAILCLYQASYPADQARLKPILDALVKANLDPNRYYGPPRMKPHNHGVMADRELLNVANLFNDTALASKAETRLAMQMDGMYDSCGFMREQSSTYQHFHAGLWDTVADRVMTASFVDDINRRIGKIRGAAYAVTWPSGVVPTIGDSGVKTVDDLTLVDGDIDYVCPDTGWLSNRVTNAGGVTQQIVARFGPATILHGHADKGEVLWWAGRGSAGNAVLVDRGLPGKNRDANYEYAVGPKAHPVLLWPGGSSRRSTARVETSGATTMSTITTTSDLGTWTRVINSRADKPVLVIRDVVGGGSGSKPAISNLPLDPTWVPAGTPGTFQAADGATLTIACTTRAGRPLTVTSAKVLDFQQAPTFRPAYTASCRVDQALLGINVTLSVTPAP